MTEINSTSVEALQHDLRNSTPFDLSLQEIDDLFEEAKVWLDGEPVKTQEQADTVAKLLDLARKAKKTADTARKVEAKPFDEGKAEIQARYKPILSKADLIADTCKKVITPYLDEQERQKREVERVAVELAEAAERTAQEAMHQTTVGDIEERAEAEKLVEQAKTAQLAANKLAKDKGHAMGGARAVSLRTVRTAEITDLSAAIKHYWAIDKSVFERLVNDLANDDVRNGVKAIPGFIINEEKVAV